MRDEIPPAEINEYFLIDRIERLDPLVNAMVHVDRPYALANGERCGEALRGWSVAVATGWRAGDDQSGIVDQHVRPEPDLALASQAFFERFDLLVGPVMPIPPYAVDRDVPEGFTDEDWSWYPYTYPWNMTGQPAASVPIGFTGSSLPGGVQIIGRLGGESDILRAAAAIETRRPLHRRRPAPSRSPF